MSFNLAYCSNVFPSEHFDDVIGVLDKQMLELRTELGLPSLDVGLYLSAEAARHIQDTPHALETLTSSLTAAGLRCRTFNGFPYGNFHGEVVKQTVYEPDWTTQERVDYTIRLADILAALIPNHAKASISTVAGGFKARLSQPDQLRAMARHLALVAQHLNTIYVEQGKTITLALEPEPFTTLETTPEAVSFFKDFLLQDGTDEVRRQHGEPRDVAEAMLRRHIGICYDCCHQAVEFEDPALSLDSLRHEGIQIAKMQLSNALELRDPAACDRLREYVEPRYLHQAFTQDKVGTIIPHLDLEDFFASNQRDFSSLRAHFHLPLFFDSDGPFGSTQKHLIETIYNAEAMGIVNDYEIETYTWSVLPKEHIGQDLIESLAKEYRWAKDTITRIQNDMSI